MSETGEMAEDKRCNLCRMKPDTSSLYQALLARDARFDGTFFVGVTSTGIYCRPICPVKPPKETNCQFYKSAPEAEQAGFRPCLRCRPELAPGNAPVDHSARLAQRMVERIEQGTFEEKAALAALAGDFQLSARQIRRIIRKELGVAPIQLLLTRRLLLAKQLLTETKLPITEIAFASGFSSLRRFNDAFSTRYAMPPTRLRKQAREDIGAFSDTETSTLQLAYRPPYDWAGLLAFLGARQLKGVEAVTGHSYSRTVQLGAQRGWIKVTQASGKNVLRVEFTHSLTPALPALLSRLRDLFDLNARPDLISRQLGQDSLLGSLVRANPGLRVPGAFHGFELGLRAIVGQQITVRAATTVASRIAAAFGERIETPFPELDRLSPTAARIAKASVDDLANLGLVRVRCQSILALAQAQVSGELSLESSAYCHPNDIIGRLTELPGIGLWTAHYIAMRAFRWPDAFPSGDLVLRSTLGGLSAKEAEERSQAWRPWRSYAVLHLWRQQPSLEKKGLRGPKIQST